MDPKFPELCKFCGERVHFIADDSLERPGASLRWLVVDASGLSIHKCRKNAVRVYTEEEKREFERKRLAGAI